MCGRFTLTTDPEQLQLTFPWVSNLQGIAPRYNIAPTQPVAVIPNDGKDKLDFFTWGLVPSWAKDPQIGSRMINARGETLAEKPSFRNAYRRRRCLILADGFYEWQKQPGSSAKTPVYIKLLDGSLFAFAGLWEIWQSPDGSEIRSCAIITTEPNELVKPIHDRMPVILSPQSYSAWLASAERNPEEIQPLLRPYPANLMTAFPVSRQVNSPANDSPDLIKPVKG